MTWAKNNTPLCILGVEPYEMSAWRFCLEPFFSDIRFNEYDWNAMVIGACDVTSPPHWTKDKFALYRAQEIEVLDKGVVSTPGWWVKPRFSWSGMGSLCWRVSEGNGQEVGRGKVFGLDTIGVENLAGPDGLSIDLVLDKGGYVAGQVWGAERDSEGRFTGFHRLHEVPSWFPVLDLYKFIGPHTGAVNVETIGKKVLEIHTRLSGQFLGWNSLNLPLYLISVMYPDEVSDEWDYSLPSRQSPVVSWVYNAPMTSKARVNALATHGVLATNTIHLTREEETLAGWKRLAYLNTEGCNRRPPLFELED